MVENGRPSYPCRALCRRVMARTGVGTEKEVGAVYFNTQGSTVSTAEPGPPAEVGVHRNGQSRNSTYPGHCLGVEKEVHIRSINTRRLLLPSACYRWGRAVWGTEAHTLCRCSRSKHTNDGQPREDPSAAWVLGSARTHQLFLRLPRLRVWVPQAAPSHVKTLPTISWKEKPV